MIIGYSAKYKINMGRFVRKGVNVKKGKQG